MGSGISHVLAEVGLDVLLFDLEDKFLERSLSGISKNMDRQIARDTLTDVEKEAALGRIRTVRDLAALGSVDFIIEAITENLDVKVRTFQEIDEIAGPNVILASNTSSISITAIASTTKRSENVIGMHFMNPVTMMQLVEVVRGEKTSDETVNTTMDLARQMGKTPVLVNDHPGFVSNRILIPMINEAAFCLMEGVATAEAIDSIMTLGMNHPLGPLALADLIGLDVCLDIMEVLHAGFGDAKYRPCPLLLEMVKADHLGRKSGRGFYSY